jgi:flagellar basal-body rod modification protein FlgD
MATPIQPTTAATSGSAAAPSNPNSMVDTQMFLKLLVAQVSHQDPMQPTDSAAWLGQMAQMSSVEQLNNLAKTSKTAANDAAMTSAVSLLGRTVSYVTADGSAAQGAVERVDLGSSGPTLTISGTSGIAPASLVDVR